MTASIHGSLPRMRRRVRLPGCALLTALLLSACVSLPDLRHPAPELPAKWPEGQSGTAIAPDWWKVYGDPVLDKLIEEAFAHNRDLMLAAARIEEARANLGLTRASQFPMVQAGAKASRSRTSEVGSFPPPQPVNNNFNASLEAAYEVDLWGRYREATRAARADLLASQYAREVVRLTLAADVARGYFTLRALDGQLALAAETLANRQAATGLNRLRFQEGIDSELTLHQAEAELAATESSRALLAGQLRQQGLALAVPLGREPRAILEDTVERGAALGEMTLPPAIPAGLPSDLLQRRPDLRQAEQQLAATQARIGEVRAALYPNLSLTGYLGSESTRLSDLFSGPAAIWGLTASLVQTVYNAGRTKSAIAAADARQTQALVAYEQTLRQSFREVLDALALHRQAREQAEAETRRSEALARATDLADLRYRNGIASYLEVLDAQRNLYAARQNAIDTRRAQLAASVDLVKSLGGGWQEDDLRRAEREASASEEEKIMLPKLH